MVHHELPSRRHLLIAAVLSTPSIVGALLMTFGRIAEALGNRDIGSNLALGVIFIMVLVLVPWATVGLAIWVISSWANHGTVPAWLLYTFGGNAIVFGYFYPLTH